MAVIIFDKRNKDQDINSILGWIVREYKCDVSVASLSKDGDLSFKFSDCKGLPKGNQLIYALCEFILNGVYTIKVIWHRDSDSLVGK